MALGTITRPSGAIANDFKVSNHQLCIRDVQLTSGANYTTGGEPLTAKMVGLRRIDAVWTDGGAKNAAGTSLVPVRYDYTNGKLQAYRYDGASAGKAFLEEVAASVDLSTFTVRLTFIGQ